MLNYISHNITRSSSPEMFGLMQAMDGFFKGSEGYQSELAPYTALGLTDAVERYMLQMADTDNPNEKGAIFFESIDAMAYQLHLNKPLLLAFLKLAVETGVLKAEYKEEEGGCVWSSVWSPDVERCLREWRKGRDARKNGGRNSHKGKSEDEANDSSSVPLSLAEKQEYSRLQSKKKSGEGKFTLSEEEEKRLNALATRAIMARQELPMSRGGQ